VTQNLGTWVDQPDQEFVALCDRFRPDDEAELIERLRAGDSNAFEQVVREHGGQLLACARRILGCPEESADAVQDGFISAFRAIQSFAASSRIGTWLHRIVVNHCLMRLRRRKNQPTLMIEDVMPAFDETGHHARSVHGWREVARDPLVRDELCTHVRQCVDRLPAPYREVILLRDIEEMSTGDVADLLHTNRSVVKTRLNRARQALRTLLDRHYFQVA
jgi:RNA polymerase sigma-70 factor (ECF subfamily)